INIDPTGIDDLNTKGELQVYPNPFSTGFTINVPDEKKEAIYDLQLLNLLGQVIYQAAGSVEDLNTGLSSIGGSVPSGSYWLLLSNGDVTYRKQVVRW